MIAENKTPVLRRFCCLLILVLSMSFGANAQYTTQDIRDYIDKYNAMAIKKMKDYGIPASITLSQGILESAAGTSELARNANNHFGIKCHSTWKGKTYYKDDDKKDECFRVYNSVEDSYNDHSDFLKRPRYASLFTLNPTDYKSWAHELKKCGYATDPNYPVRLINLIETYSLYQYDSDNYQAKKHQKSPKVKKEPKKQVIQDQVIEIKNKKYALVDYPYSRRLVYINNNVYFIIAQSGDSFYQIALDVQLTISQLRRYNDIKSRKYEPQEGEVIYISKKAKYNMSAKEHVVCQGESLHSIAQDYAIRIRTLRKLNNLSTKEEPSVGTRLTLK